MSNNFFLFLQAYGLCLDLFSIFSTKFQNTLIFLLFLHNLMNLILRKEITCVKSAYLLRMLISCFCFWIISSFYLFFLSSSLMVLRLPCKRISKELILSRRFSYSFKLIFSFSSNFGIF
jgi:hypothetical protein